MTLKNRPVNRENFEWAWHYARRKYCRTKKKRAARRAAAFLSHLLFFAAFLLLGYGVVCARSQDPAAGILSRIPLISELWRSFSAFLFKNAQTDPQKLIRMIAFLYGLPIAGAMTVTLLIWLLYHPLSPTLPKEEVRQARALWLLSRELRSFQGKQLTRSYLFYSLIFGILSAGALMMLFLYSHLDPGTGSLLSSSSERWGPLILALPGTTAAYFLLSLPLLPMLIPLNRSYVPEIFHRKVSAYYEEVRKGLNEPPSSPEEPSQKAFQEDP